MLKTIPLARMLRVLFNQIQYDRPCGYSQLLEINLVVRRWL